MIKLILKLPDTEMIKIIEKYFKFENLALKEEFELQFDENNSDFAIKFENAVI